jgi:type I restriction enzyme S subunit
MKFRWETEFKETEIGEIPKDWEVKKLRKMCSKIQYGYTQSASTKPIGPKFLRITDIVGKDKINWEEVPYCKINDKEKEKYLLKDGDIVIARTGAYVGSSIIVEKPPEAIFASYLIRIQLDENKASPKYIYYVLRSGYFAEYVRASYGGSAQPHANAKVLSSVDILSPEVGEQTRIATVLSWFDDLIENKRKQNEILEKMAMAIFKSWFIDFEPFQDEEFVYSKELDMEIPKGWEVGGLKNIAEVIMGQSPPSKYYNQEGEGLPFIQGKGQLGQYTPYTEVYTTQITKLAKPLDVLVTVRAPIGEINIADNEYVIGRGLAALRSKFWPYLYVYLRIYNEVLKSFERGTTFDAITKPELEGINILIPPQPILQRFHSLVEPLFQKILLNQKQILTLKKIRDTLLPQLVFGKLRIEEL